MTALSALPECLTFRTINSPKIEGVVVVAQGAGTGRKDTEIIEAVQALFEVESHKIKVMRME